jgi:hypothetical protein
VEQGLILKKEAEKSTYINEPDARKPLVVSVSQRSTGRIDTLQSGLQFDNIKPILESVIFKCISRLNDLLFQGGDDRVLRNRKSRPF